MLIFSQRKKEAKPLRNKHTLRLCVKFDFYTDILAKKKRSKAAKKCALREIKHTLCAFKTLRLCVNVDFAVLSFAF